MIKQVLSVTDTYSRHLNDSTYTRDKEPAHGGVDEYLDTVPPILEMILFYRPRSYKFITTILEQKYVRH